MEFYVLDDNFNRQDLIDGYISALWTERYSVTGDFEFVFTKEQYDKHPSLVNGAFVQEKDSIHVGIVEDEIFKEGRVFLKGTFLEHFLRFRSVGYVGSASDPEGFKDSLYRSGVPEVVMALCVYTYAGGYLDLGDTLGIDDYEKEQFTNLDVGLPFSETYPSTPVLSFSYPNPTNMYDFMVQTAEPNGIGWRFYPVPNGVDYDLIFRPYRGLDRTRDQGVNSPVIFGESFDSLKSVEEVHTSKNYITNVHIFAPNIDPSEYSYNPKDIVGKAQAPGTENFTDFKRRTVILKADDITKEDYHWWNSSSDNGILKAWEVLNQRAKDVIANSTLKRMLDGEVNFNNQFHFGTDYFMGDLVTLKGFSNTYQNARIIEFIRSEDQTGYKAYPTITVF